MKKRILSLFLALGMLLSLLPSAALAVGRGTDSVPASSEVSAAPVEARSNAAVKGGGGGGLLWHSNFEDENSLFGWQIISANGDGSTFARVQDSYTSDWCLSSNESISKAYSQSPPDDYVITPRIDLPKSDCEYTLGVKGGVTSSGSLVGFALYVYTGTEMLRPDNLYTLLGQYYRFDVFCWSDWNWKYFDLSAYAGQTVQIVVRRFDDEMNNNALKLAELAISYQEPDEQLSKVTAFNVPLPELGVSAKTLKARESEITFPDYANYELVPGSLTYYKFVGEDSEEMHNQVFTEDGQYSLHFRVRPKAGVEVYEQGCASVNGNWAQFTYLSTTEEVSIAFWGMPALVPAKEVREVNLRVMAPVVGKDQDTTAERWLADGSTDYHYTVSEYDWDPPGSGVFESGVEYGLWDGIDLEEGYTMAENPHFTVNREPAVCLGSAETNEWYIIKSFPADCKEPIVSAALSLEKPRADQYPGWPSPYNPDFWVVSCNWYPVSAFGEVQRALSEGETLEPSTSYWVYFGLKADDNYSFTESTRVIINGTEAVFYQENDGVWYYCLPVKTRSKDPITVTFNAHGHGTAPAPIEIPYGSSLWDGYYNLNDLRIENTDGMFFWGWSEYTTDRKDDRLAWEQELYEDVTLYAIWLEEYDYVTLFVDQPIVLDPIEKPNVSTTSACYFMPEPLGWWSSADGYWQDEEPLTGTFQPGKTYYGVVRMEPELDAIFGESGDVVSVIGGRKVREDLVEGEDLNDSKILYVTFSVSVPRRGEIDEIDLFVDIGWSGWLMYGTPPTQLCTTPGVGLVEGSWWANLEDVGDESKAITGRFPTDCLIYTDLQAFPSLNCSISDNPTVNIVGGTLIRTEPGSSGSVHIIYSVYSPAYHSMDFRSQGSGWFFIDDDPHAHRWYEGPFYETGFHSVTALPDPGWHFKGWYEGPKADTLVSTNRVYVFENEPSDDELWLTAVFEEGLLPIDLLEIELPLPCVGDSFNWNMGTAGAYEVNGETARVIASYWHKERETGGTTLVIEDGAYYYARIILSAKPGYEITDNTRILINGEEAAGKVQNDSGTWTAYTRDYMMEAPIYIETVEIEVPIPVAGNTFNWSTDSAWAKVTNGAQVQITRDAWYTEWGISGDPLVFELGEKYFVGIDLKGIYPNRMTEDTVFRINGEEVPWKQQSNIVTWSISSVNYTMKAPTNPFSDVKKGVWYYDAVMWAYYHIPQITKGTNATHFSPNQICTRCEVVTFLWRAAGCPEPTTTNNPFKDVPKSSFYYKAVLWAVEKGITKGTSTTAFSPMKECSRGEVVTFLWRAAGCPEPTTTSNPFNDLVLNSFYYKAVLWAVENGITKGTSPTAFSPLKNCTRSEVVTFLYRAFGPKS